VSLHNILKVLENKQVTFDLFKDTFIGKTILCLTKIEAINEYVKDEADKVKKKAKDLLFSWK
jgi:hypothetical protein